MEKIKRRLSEIEREAARIDKLLQDIKVDRSLGELMFPTRADVYFKEFMLKLPLSRREAQKTKRKWGRSSRKLVSNFTISIYANEGFVNIKDDIIKLTPKGEGYLKAFHESSYLKKMITKNMNYLSRGSRLLRYIKTESFSCERLIDCCNMEYFFLESKNVRMHVSFLEKEEVRASWKIDKIPCWYRTRIFKLKDLPTSLKKEIMITKLTKGGK